MSEWETADTLQHFKYVLDIHKYCCFVTMNYPPETEMLTLWLYSCLSPLNSHLYRPSSSREMFLKVKLEISLSWLYCCVTSTLSVSLIRSQFLASSCLHQVMLSDFPQSLTGQLTVTGFHGAFFIIVPLRIISCTSHDGTESEITRWNSNVVCHSLRIKHLWFW